MCWSRFGATFVLKWAQLGYDGKGVHFADLDATTSGETVAGHVTAGFEESRKFCEIARARGIAVFAEEKIPFARELAITACRGADGALALYPVVETEQRDGVCHRVRGPATAFGLSTTHAAEIADWIGRFGERLDIVGAFTFELFDTARGILVNEIAPRVHNSAHYSQDATRCSQFEQHLRAVLRAPFHDPECAPYFGMLNLMGPPGLTLEETPARLENEWARELATAGFILHWYGKRGARPGRKLGHVNFRAENRAEFDRLWEKLPAVEIEFRRILGSR